jgi:hypothetical protein
MNFGAVFLALFFVGASIFAIFAIASSNQDSYTDTFNDTQSTNTTATRGLVQNTTAPLVGAAGGLALVFGFFIVVIAVVFLIKTVGSSSYSGRR